MYDVFIIGGGPAGYVAAIKAAQLGMTAALAEDRKLGGTCLNRGCIPTKTLVHAASSYRSLSEMAYMGIDVPPASFDYGRMQAYKSRTLDTIRDGVSRLLQANHVEIYDGQAVVEAPDRVSVGGKTVEAEHILVAAGCRPSFPPIPGADGPGVFTSDFLLEQEHPFYKRLVIIGGGVVGIELAGVYADLGSEVTVIEGLDRILPILDREFSQNLSMILKKRGVSIYTASTVTAVERDGAELICRFSSKKGEMEARGDGVLMAAGRRPCTDGLFAPGFEPDMERGFIKVNARYESSLPGVYAVGDCNGIIQQAHAAEAQGAACVEYIAGRSAPSIDPDVVPICVYVEPEIACCGITADEAKQQGIPTVAGKYVMSGNAKIVMEHTERSFIKLVFHAQTDVLLGAQLMCPRATDIITELNTAVKNGLTSAQLLSALRPHPTFAEGITEAVEAAHGQAIHVMPAGRRG